ncbi:MAG: chorismate-binding protein, partial [Candidatus Eremiobacteraeota bacterium]|nr:chorismate-binding protein [Candidatus Eremiobacteraeota bacterium]
MRADRTIPERPPGWLHANHEVARSPGRRRRAFNSRARPGIEALLKTEPLSLYPVVRELVADTITPISAYLALAEPGRSCLLESVEGTERISRFSLIGLDYIESRAFDDEPHLLDEIRAMIGRYRLAQQSPFPGAAVCLISYDAARVLERIGPKPPRDMDFADALVLVPGTWVIFDHFTHRMTLVGFASHETQRADVAERLERYLARLRDARPTTPAQVVADRSAEQSLAKDEFLQRVARAKSHIYEGDAYQLQIGIRFSATISGGNAFDFYRQIRARNPSPYMFFIEDGGRAVFGASPEFLVR